MEGPPLGPGGEDITWPDQVADRGRKASSTRKIKPQTSNLTWVERSKGLCAPRAKGWFSTTGPYTALGIGKETGGPLFCRMVQM